MNLKVGNRIVRPGMTVSHFVPSYHATIEREVLAVTYSPGYRSGLLTVAPSFSVVVLTPSSTRTLKINANTGEIVNVQGRNGEYARLFLSQRTADADMIDRFYEGEVPTPATPMRENIGPYHAAQLRNRGPLPRGRAAAARRRAA